MAADQDLKTGLIAPLPRRRQGITLGFKAMFASFLLLTTFIVGFLLFNFTRNQSQQPAFIPHHDAEEAEADQPKNEVVVVDSYPSEPGTIFPSRDQFDLRTGFAVSDQPTTREYVFNITRGFGAPDGWTKSMILVNGQSPGPLIEANTGDRIRVTINNLMPEESTTIHWHGIDQRNSVWMDGVQGVTQCAIPPGESFDYEFDLIDQRGTFWYHSHVSVQYTDGLFGPIIIHDPSEMTPAVQDEKVIMVGDLYHQEASKLLEKYLTPQPPWSKMMGMEPPINNIIINGRHITNCSNPPTEFPFVPESRGDDDDNSNETSQCSGGSIFATRVKSGDSVRLRLISHSSNMPYWFTVDSHALEIVEMDGVEIEPITTSRIFMNPGQRYSVILKADQTAGNYLMRAEIAKGCGMISRDKVSGLASIDFQATAILSYDDVSEEEPPIGQPWALEESRNAVLGREPWSEKCQEMPFDSSKPMRKMAAYEVGEKNSHYFTFDMMRSNDMGLLTRINETIYSPLQDDATLWKALEQDMSSENLDADKPSWDFGLNQEVLVSRDPNGAAQIVINADNMMTHPWHLQLIDRTIGQTFQVVGWGPNRYGLSATTWNLENPMRRDTLTMPGSSHVVIRFAADNPGVWALHCHILWHAEGGMFISTAQQLDKLKDMVESLSESEGESPTRRRFCSAPSTLR